MLDRRSGAELALERGQGCRVWDINGKSYLDALAGWFVRSNLRQWYIVYEDTEEGRAQYERLRYSIRERHFGAREVGATRLAVGASGGTTLTNAVRRANADAIFLLMGAEGQLRTLAELDKAGITAQTTGTSPISATDCSKPCTPGNTTTDWPVGTSGRTSRISEMIAWRASSVGSSWPSRLSRMR